MDATDSVRLIIAYPFNLLYSNDITREKICSQVIVWEIHTTIGSFMIFDICKLMVLKMLVVSQRIVL